MNSELYDIAFSPVNIGLSIFVIILVLYWLATMFFGFDSDLDIDIDVDADLDADLDLEQGMESGNMDLDDLSNVELQKEDVIPDRRKKLKWWQIFLVYFNFVGLPFMFTLTAFIFTWWILSMVTTSITHSYASNLGYLFLLGTFIPALVITKFITNPFKPIFKKLNKEGDQPIDFLGREGISLSNIKERKLGNAEVMVDGSPMSIYIKSLDQTPIHYQDPILIIKEGEDKTFYYVKNISKKL